MYGCIYGNPIDRFLIVVVLNSVAWQVCRSLSTSTQFLDYTVGGNDGFREGYLTLRLEWWGYALVVSVSVGEETEWGFRGRLKFQKFHAP